MAELAQTCCRPALWSGPWELVSPAVVDAVHPGCKTPAIASWILCRKRCSRPIQRWLSGYLTHYCSEVNSMGSSLRPIDRYSH